MIRLLIKQQYNYIYYHIVAVIKLLLMYCNNFCNTSSNFQDFYY